MRESFLTPLVDEPDKVVLAVGSVQVAPVSNDEVVVVPAGKVEPVASMPPGDALGAALVVAAEPGVNDDEDVDSVPGVPSVADEDGLGLNFSVPAVVDGISVPVVPADKVEIDSSVIVVWAAVEELVVDIDVVLEVDPTDAPLCVVVVARSVVLSEVAGVEVFTKEASVGS